MMMQKYQDLEHNSDAFVSIRDCGQGMYGLGFSIAVNGDIETAISKSDLKKVVAMLVKFTDEL